MEIELFRKVITDLENPEIIRLNYSGESIHYPHLEEAIQLSGSTGAATELVSALSTANNRTVRTLVDAGLDRLTISLHSLDGGQYREIYGADRLLQLRDRVRELLEYREACGKAKPVLDFSFVAMADNLNQLEPLAKFAAQAGSPSICVHPVIRRDPVAADFSGELDRTGGLRAEFIEKVRKAVESARGLHAAVEIEVARPEVFAEPDGSSDAVPTCEQNPWETVHILSNGDVVPCEVHDRVVMGNLNEQDLAAIWTGPRYSEFRARYSARQIPACNSCPWRRSSSHKARSADSGVGTVNLVWGWYPPDGEDIQWGKRRSLLLVSGGEGESVTIAGAVPPSQSSENPGKLIAMQDGILAANVENDGCGVRMINLTFELQKANTAIEFIMEAPYCPAEAGTGRDQRYLGFGFLRANFSGRSLDPDPAGKMRGLGTGPRARCKNMALDAWLSTITSLDRVAQATRRRRPLRTLPLPQSGFKPGMSVVIPERGSPEQLFECLAAVEQAAARVCEPVEVIAVVNGSAAEEYDAVRREFPGAAFQFHDKPLGFSDAVCRGAAAARQDWTYLLNSDVVVAEEALVQILEQRRTEVFSIGSQLHPYECGALRTETNFTEFGFDDGMVQAKEIEPGLDVAVRASAYCGGGSSLFQTRLLRLAARATLSYDPFYWEDIEWGAMARRNGYLNLFCPGSRVRHRHRATIRRFYSSDEISRIVERNQFLFQIRNAPSLVRRSALEFYLRGLPAATIRELANIRIVRETIKARYAAIAGPVGDAKALGL